MAKIAKKVADAIREDVELRCRVQRPHVLDLFLDGEFPKLPAIKSNVIDAPYLRITGRRDGTVSGFPIPTEDLGRVGTPSASVAESIRLWIKQNLSEVIPVESVAVVYEARDNEVVIYRKG